MTLAAYLHDLDPVLLPIWGNIAIRWYGLSYIAGFVAAYFFMRTLRRRGLSQLPEVKIGDFIVALALGTVVGGRLGYCLFYRPELLSEFRPSLPFWGVLAIHEGGMASHGGIFGMLLACVYFGVRQKLNVRHLFDLVVVAGPIGVFFGRVANFINGELYGRPCDERLPWAVKFPQEMHDWNTDQLQPLVRAMDTLGFRTDPPAALIDKAIVLIRQGNSEVAEAVAPLLAARHPSQLYEALLEGLLLVLALMLIWMRPRKPGVVAGWFLVLYPMLRIVGEQFRTPDSHIGFQWLGLTRGQWISIVMLAAGALCLWLWSRRPAEKLGGWGRGNRLEP